MDKKNHTKKRNWKRQKIYTLFLFIWNSSLFYFWYKNTILLELFFTEWTFCVCECYWAGAVADPLSFSWSFVRFSFSIYFYFRQSFYAFCLVNIASFCARRMKCKCLSFLRCLKWEYKTENRWHIADVDYKTSEKKRRIFKILPLFWRILLFLFSSSFDSIENHNEHSILMPTFLLHIFVRSFLIIWHWICILYILFIDIFFILVFFVVASNLKLNENENFMGVSTPFSNFWCTNSSSIILLELQRAELKNTNFMQKIDRRINNHKYILNIRKFTHN